MIGLFLSVAIAGASDSPYEVHEEALTGGDTLVVVADDRAPVVYVRVDFPVGLHSAWAVEHDLDTAWTIQEHDPDGALLRRADELAVRVGLYQSNDTTWLTLSCLADDLDAALALGQDVLANTAFDRAELKRWRKGERIDWSSNRTSPGWQASRLSAELFYSPGDPRLQYYDGPRKIETDPEELAATRDAVLSHSRRLVGVTGDVDVDTARRVAEALLPASAADAPTGDLAYEPFREAATRPEVSEEAMKDLTQVTLRLVREGLTLDDPDYPASMIAAHVLAGHAHARLGQALRYEDGSTYGVGMSGAADLYPGVLTISTSTRTDNAEAAEARLLEALGTFHADGITDEERADAVTHLLGQEPFREQNPWTPMAERMWELRHDLPRGFRTGALQRASELTTEQVNAFIARFYDPATFSRVHVVPR